MKLFDKNERELRKAMPIVKKIDSYQEEYSKLSDDELRSKTDEFKERLSRGETLEQILPEAYAVVKEASTRTLGMTHFDEQLIGGIVLHQGRISEQKTGEGKAVTLTTRIPTPNGWKLAGDIKVGDMLFDNHGHPTEVLAVYPQGKKEVYEVELLDGRVIECAADHLWQVYKRYEAKRPRVIDTKTMFDFGIKARQDYNFFLPVADAVEYSKKELPIDPYVFGLMLARGRKNDCGSILIYSVEEECARKAAEALGAKGYKQSRYSNDWSFYADDVREDLPNRRMKVRNFAPEWEEFLTDTETRDRYVPDLYKYSSIEQRKALLQGLMDGSGFIPSGEEQKFPNYNPHFSHISRQLAKDVAEIVLSLGMYCRYSPKRRGTPEHPVSDIYVVTIYARNERKPSLFRGSSYREIAMKAMDRKARRRDNSKVAIADIRKTGRMEEQVCFTVDNPEHLFLVGDYVVTHNTLVSTCPAYLNALEGKGVHIVTVNDYLAQRDAEQMGKIHRFLGLSVGCVLHDMQPDERREAYACDITYVTNNELGFDYLKDNMAVTPETQVLRGLNYCIIDEVDSILIDEARTPLIISGQSGKSTNLYVACDALAKTMVRGKDLLPTSKIDLIMGEEQEESGDFMINEKEKNVIMTELGIQKTEQFFKIENLSDPKNIDIQHGIILALRANYLMHLDKDYVVRDGEILIVDEFTGRTMPGRRFSDGLHQAIEAKEGVEIRQESQTLATITFQNFFNKFKKKSGMTGTAKTEEKEFRNTYGMDVICVPTHKPVIRVDHTDKVYRTKAEKYRAVINDVIETHKKGQPVLVGTTAIDTSELLSAMLHKKGIQHSVLNAKFHEMEAHIVEHAGEYGAVTIATNMAGRGTDIKLDARAREAGGLKIIGTERHDSRRIDNQLRGRSGRQGDPGESVFYLSLEDDLLRLFGQQQLMKSFDEMGVAENESIESKMLTNAITRAHQNIENNNFDMRENLMKYDAMNNEQREFVYGEREYILHSDDIQDGIVTIINDIAMDADLKAKMQKQPALAFIRDLIPAGYDLTEEDTKLSAKDLLLKIYKEKEDEFFEPSEMRQAEKIILLRTLDRAWISHLENIDYLKESINLRAYGQKDPVVEYRMTGYQMFDDMIESVKRNAIWSILSMRGSKVQAEMEARKPKITVNFVGKIDFDEA